MDFVCKLYGNTHAVHVTVALVGVATWNLALPAPLVKMFKLFNDFISDQICLLERQTDQRPFLLSAIRICQV